MPKKVAKKKTSTKTAAKKSAKKPVKKSAAKPVKKTAAKPAKKASGVAKKKTAASKIKKETKKLNKKAATKATSKVVKKATAKASKTRTTKAKAVKAKAVKGKVVKGKVVKKTSALAKKKAPVNKVKKATKAVSSAKTKAKASTKKQAASKKPIKKIAKKTSTKKSTPVKAKAKAPAKKATVKAPAKKTIAKKQSPKKTIAKAKKEPAIKTKAAKRKTAAEKPVEVHELYTHKLPTEFAAYELLKEEEALEEEKEAMATAHKEESAEEHHEQVDKEHDKHTEEHHEHTAQEHQAKPAKKHATHSIENEWRLPRFAIPEHYQITLQPDLESKSFTGQVEIEIDIHEETSEIVLNAKELEIDEAYLLDENGKESAAQISYDEEKEFAFLAFEHTVHAGSYKLKCEFKGVLNSKLKGFYYSSWTDEHGSKHPMAVTQFESTDARRAFPCFDEPDFKATYDVTLIVPKELTALSNGRITDESVDDHSGLKTVHFKRTMKMSTYLLAFLVGEFEPSHAVTANGIEVRAWTVPGKEHLTKFSLDVAAYTIDYFEKYFGVNYPAPDKCDLVAIPDFAAGAMENKDCITFRETALLLDENTATQSEKERVAEVVMHELAHMWFGDLVTMRWWNGLWLNEAFATFMEMKALDAYKPEWKVWDKFGLSRAAAMRVDSLKSTHPIECPVKNPDEVQELFDVISYQKGCSVLYQIEQFIGEDIFQSGINHYLNKHAYGNTETHDLWDSLEHACTSHGVDIPVRKIMDNWVFTAGHPMLTLEKEDDSLQIKQKPFMFLPDEKNHTLYEVPVTMRIKYADGGAKSEKLLLTDREESVALREGCQYVVANAGGSGFYRVNYAPELAKTLLANPEENLSVIERFNLVSDSWAGVRAGFMPLTEYMDMIKLFKHEDDVNVWAIIISSLNGLRHLTEGQSRENFKHFVKDLVETKAHELGWEAKAHEISQTKQLRGLLLESLGTTAEDGQTYEEALRHFDQWKHDKSSIDSNLLPAIVNTLAYHGDNERYEQFKHISKEAKTPQETLRFLYALAQFRDKHLLDKTMASCLTDEVRTQDAPFLFAMIAGNEIATESAWHFLNQHWNEMVKAYPDTGVVRMCSGVIPALDKPELEEEAKRFFAQHKVKSGDMAISQALEMLRVNVLLREREEKNLAHYLEQSTTHSQEEEQPKEEQHAGGWSFH